MDDVFIKVRTKYQKYHLCVNLVFISINICVETLVNSFNIFHWFFVSF